MKRPYLLLSCALLSACNLKGKAADLREIDRDDIEEVVDDTIDKVGNIAVCGDMTIEELATEDAISDSCRAEIEKYLPPAQTNFKSRVFSMGASVDAAANTTTLYLQGARSDGAAISAAAFASARFAVSGSVQADLVATVRGIGEATTDLASIAVANDYSASMLAQDLDRVADIQTQLFTCLPPVYEAEVTYFSKTVTVDQPFTTDEALIFDSLARDDSVERSSTALFDGVGDAMESLSMRARPLKLLIVSSDGRENSSMRRMQAEVLSQIEQSGAFVIVLSALLADVDEMKALAGDRGVYFYTPFYDRLDRLVAPFCNALEEAVEVVVDRALSAGDTITIESEGQAYTVVVPGA